jgi:hypothetical protein
MLLNAKIYLSINFLGGRLAGMVFRTLNKVETKLILFGGPLLPSSKASESGQPISKHKIYSFLDFGDVD